MSTDQPSPPPSSPDELPPVQPPSAGFLVQLFLVPGIVVAIIVVVWVMVDWLAHMETDPQAYVEGLRRDTPDSWQKAESLAEMLQSDRSGLKDNAKLAGTLAEILDEKLKAGATDEAAINLRIYLSYALGKFNTPVGLPTLLKAVSTNRDPKELPVRRAALDATAQSIFNVQKAAPKALLPYKADLLATLLTASRDPEAVIRLRAAYCLGLVGGEQAVARLKVMCDDPNREVDYNAATGLARQGDTAAINTLLKMLDPAPLAAASTPAKSAADAKNDPDLQTDPAVVILNGLRAAELLADANPTADLSRLLPAVNPLRKAGMPLAIRDAALGLYSKLEKRPAPAEKPSK